MPRDTSTMRQTAVAARQADASRYAAGRTPRRVRRGRSSGQIMIMLAASMMVIVAMLAVAIDGGFGDVEHRRAQNAADAASVAGAKLLNAWCERKGLSIRPSENDLYTTMSEVIAQNDPGIPWTADYLDTNGVKIGPPPGYQHWFSVSVSPPLIRNAPQDAPDTPDACGVQVNSSPKWTTFFATIVGHSTLTSATGAIAGNAKSSAQSIGIISLDQTDIHAVLGGGFGTFTVDSDIRLNFQGCCDAIDVKEGSKMDINGAIYSPIFAPLDPFCWPTRVGPWPTGGPNAYPASEPWNGGVGWKCNPRYGTGVVSYNSYGIKPVFPDPLAEPLGAPYPTEGYVPFFVGCDKVGPFYSLPVYPAGTPASVWEPRIPPVVGPPTVQPGIYNFPVKISTTTRFADCTGPAGAHQYDPAGVAGTSTPPGIFVMQQGLDIHLSAGQRVDGLNVMIATSSPFPEAGNVPFNPAVGAPNFGRISDGNGSPCLIGTAGYTQEIAQLNQGLGPEPMQAPRRVPCAGAPGQFATPDANHADGGPIADCNVGCTGFTPEFWGTGQNDSLIIEGSGGTVTLEAAQSGLYAQMLFFQDRQHDANFGFDAKADDAVNINVLGTLYNAISGNGASAAPWSALCPTFNRAPYWGVPQPCDGPDAYAWASLSDGIPLRAGGILQVGYGINELETHPSKASAVVNISGVAVVTDFNTDGLSAITIAGLALQVPGASPPNPVLSK